MKDDNTLTANTAAAFLSSISKILNHWSMLSALAALLILGLKQGNVFLAASLLTALFQAWFAVRCAFDAAMFAVLGSDATHYESFDRILTRWQLHGAITVTRSLDERVKGAIRLLRWQAVSFFVQILLLAMALMNSL